MRTWKMEVSGHRNIGRPKVVQKDTKETGVQRETQDRKRGE